MPSVFDSVSGSCCDDVAKKKKKTDKIKNQIKSIDM